VQGLPEERVIVDEQHRDGTEHTGTALLLDVTCIYRDKIVKEFRRLACIGLVVVHI
jgi:hypothetical protein